MINGICLNGFKIESSWVMKMDPDEYLSDELKQSIKQNIHKDNFTDSILIEGFGS